MSTSARPRPDRRPVRGGSSALPIADLTNAFGSVFAAVSLALIAAYLVADDIRPWLGAPDGLLSWAAGAGFLIALVIGVWAARRSPEGGFRLLIPLSALTLLGQQIRWGTDAIGIPFPTISGVEVSSLIDLRTVVSLNAELLGLGAPTAIAVLLAVLGATATVAVWARRWADHRVLVTEAAVVMWFVLSLGFAAAVPAFGIFGEGTGAWFGTGMAELFSSGTLVMAALAAGDHRRIVAGWRRRMWPWITQEGSLPTAPSDAR